MALATLTQRILSSHANFFREGDSFTVPGAGTCARASKPGAADGGWIDLGIVEACDLKVEPIKEQKTYAAAPGRLQVYDVLTAGHEMALSFTLAEMHYWHVELMLRTAKLTNASTQANPLEGTTFRGWLKFSHYDQSQVPGATALLIADWFVALKCTGGLTLAGGDILKPQFEAQQLYSLYNTVAI